jgi:hypothetical protein
MGWLGGGETTVFDDGGWRAVAGGVPGWTYSKMWRRGR